MSTSLRLLLLFSLASAWGADNAVPAGSGVLWQEPKDIGSRNLIYGPGGKKHEPHGQFTFQKEDLDGTNPKFVVRDEEGTKWKVKLGVEARPETAASRLVWAVGYFTNEDYFLPRLRVEGLPDHLKRGENLKQADGSFLNVRMKRYLKHEEKAGNWEWRDNPFTGTHELNGLRVMMALINNWDLKDENNAVYDEDIRKVYMVSDLGASFGTTGESWSHERSKGNIEQYRRSKFIQKSTATSVSFYVPTRPALVFLFNPPEFFGRVHLRWIGRQIPQESVTWIAAELAKLSPQQIRDAFRSAGYSAEEVDALAGVVERRIAELREL